MKQHNQPPPRDIIAAFRTDPAYQPLIEAFDAFRKTGSIDGLRGVFFPNNYELNKLGTSVADYFPWDDESSAIVDFAIHAFGLNYQPAPNHGSLSNWVWSVMPSVRGSDSGRILAGIIAEAHFNATSCGRQDGCLDALFEKISASPYDESHWVDLLLHSIRASCHWKHTEEQTQDISGQDPILAFILRTRDDVLAEFLGSISPYSPNESYRFQTIFGWAARFRPTAADLAIKMCVAASDPERLGPATWGSILKNASRYDELFKSILSKVERGPMLWHFYRQWVACRDTPVEGIPGEIESPAVAGAAGALNWLAHTVPDCCPEILRSVIKEKSYSGNIPSRRDPYCNDAFDCCLARLKDGGEEALVAALCCEEGVIALTCLDRILANMKPDHRDEFEALIIRGLRAKQGAETLISMWDVVAGYDLRPFSSVMWETLGHPSKSVRQTVAKLIIQLNDSNTVPQATAMLSSRKADLRIGAANLLAAIGDPRVSEPLAIALEAEQNDKVRSAFREAISALRPAGQVETKTQKDEPAGSFAEIEAVIVRQAANLRLRAPSWFKLETLPPLATTDGTHLSTSTLSFILTKQSKHKSIEAAPDIVPLLAHLDRSRCAPFALALVEGFLNSEQAAGDRWALALGGLLGDNRIIPPLLARIPGWCDNARHKLAEYAAQAIALLPGNEPLMVLDTLANRYRNKYKNVGKACAAAFEAAATARGITPAELGDLVVPTFEFDEEGLRTFAWDGGSVAAELGPDFKLSWFDPASDKTWSSLPAAAPAAVKEEVKLLGKLLREAVKAQTARLELTLVFQRRWPLARWRELYESHPLLRGFASGLVWGVYDASGTLLRTFRRYHNGILADAAGTEEELLEANTAIGMVHPLELDEAARQAWQAHLGRLKVKQPFPQLDRPVELLDPLLANRREIAITRDKKLSAGTFRSRAEKRGWFRGSVVDAGGISSYVKTYPAVGVEVILPLDNFYIGVDPMDTIELSAAYFVRAETVQRGSYTYDEPGPDDPRVLKFAEVPAVVYSETLGDLKAIVATKE